METLFLAIFAFIGLLWAVLAVVKSNLRKRKLEQIEYKKALDNIGKTITDFAKEVEKQM